MNEAIWQGLKRQLATGTARDGRRLAAAEESPPDGVAGTGRTKATIAKSPCASLKSIIFINFCN